MNAIRSLFYLLLTIGWLACIPVGFAQSTASRDALLALLPDDFAVCVVMNDLRGQAQRWEQSDWLKRFLKSPLGKTFLEAPELRQLGRWEKDLKKHFDLDWSTLRDDILGDTVILSYRPGASQQQEERGLVLLRARAPERLKRLIEQLNEAQKTSGELKSLTARQYKETTYYRREQGKKIQFYFLDGPLLVIATREQLMQGVLDRRARPPQDPRWAKQFDKAGVGQAFLTLCVNPRALTPEFLKHAKKDDPFPGYWRALEGIFLSLSIQDEAEVRLSIQAQTDALPGWTRPAFTQTAAPSVLWQRFPESSIATIATKTDFAGTVAALQLLMPAQAREKMTEGSQRTLGALLGLDVFKDLLPNLGPDWGICVFPAKDPEHLPMTLVAVAVEPGKMDPPLDQSLFKAVQLFAALVLLDYNKNHADAIRLQTIKQDKIEVLTLRNDKLFPPGIQPSCALKGGFLVFASAPEAILHFHRRTNSAVPSKQNPLFRLSTQELAKLLRQRQKQIIGNLQQRQQMSELIAKKNLESVITLLELFDRVSLSQHAGAGQASWSLRITPAQPVDAPR